MFLGAQAALMGMGTGFNPPAGEMGTNAFKWREEEFDYGHELGVSCNCLIGMVKSVFNSEDFGAITISTYAASH